MALWDIFRRNRLLSLFTCIFIFFLILYLNRDFKKNNFGYWDLIPNPTNPDANSKYAIFQEFNDSNLVNKNYHIFELFYENNQLRMLLNDNEIYTEQYYPMTFENIRVLVIDGRTLLFSSSRVFYVDDTDLSDDLNNYFEKIYYDNIVIIVTFKKNIQINDAIFSTLFQSKNCDANSVNNGQISVVSYVKNDQNECYAKEFNSNKFSLKLILPAFEAKELNFDCFEQKANGDELKRRREFCSRFFAFPEYCRCADPFPISFDLAVKNESVLSEIPILIMGSNRPYYLIRCIESIISADNVRLNMIVVDIDQETPELIGVIKLFNIKQTLHSAVCSHECRISEHYRSAFTDILYQFPSANNVFIFEDDLISSSDIFNYFSSKLDVYHADPSIFCVSAWNDQAYLHSVGDLTMSYRVQYMPGLGLVLSRKIIKNLISIWPVKRKMNWDAWIRESVIAGRVCIIPDVSRTFHIGKFGLHSSSNFQKSYFSRRFFLAQINIKEYDNNLNKDGYNAFMEYLAQNSETIRDSRLACDIVQNLKPVELITSPLKTKELAAQSLKVFLNFHQSGSVFIKLFKCLSIWDLDLRGINDGYARIWFGGTHFIFIGCPKSNLCKYMPQNHHMFDPV